MGRAADLLGVLPAFLRSLNALGCSTRTLGRRVAPLLGAELTVATRVRELLDDNMPLNAAAPRRIADLASRARPR